MPVVAVSSDFLVSHAVCPICGGRSRAHLTGTHDLHYGIEGEWNYDRCVDCRVVFLNPAPTARFLENAYDDSYYSYQEFRLPPRWHGWIRSLACYKPGVTGDPDFARPGRILDVGCGSGEFLFRMQRAGWETHGVELSTKAADIGNRAHSLNIQAGTLASARFSADYFDYIRLNHSFEHILDPRETLQHIRKYLAKNGLLFIGVPNVEGWAAKLFGRFWWNLGPPVHPFNYSKETLTRLLVEEGFEVVGYRTNSSFSGLLGSLQMVLNYRKGVRADNGWLFANPVAKLLFQWIAKMTDVVSAGDCLEIVARKRSGSHDA